MVVFFLLVGETERINLLAERARPREFLLRLLFLTCIWLKIVLMPKWHIWGWYILSPLRHVQQDLSLVKSRAQSLWYAKPA